MYNCDTSCCAANFCSDAADTTSGQSVPAFVPEMSDWWKKSPQRETSLNSVSASSPRRQNQDLVLCLRWSREQLTEVKLCKVLSSLHRFTLCVCVLFLRSSVMPKDCFTAARSPLILISVLTEFKNEKLAVGFCPDDFVCCPYIPYRYILCLFSLCLTISSNPNLLCFPLKSFP